MADLNDAVSRANAEANAIFGKLELPRFGGQF
jgi:hypothetical protein